MDSNKNKCTRLLGFEICVETYYNNVIICFILILNRKLKSLGTSIIDIKYLEKKFNKIKIKLYNICL
jgi:hypothetical protein